MPDKGVLIAFEGGDGSGKSTQAKLLAERLGAVLTRQAGGTVFGARVRELTLDPAFANISPRAEAMLYMADRAELVDELVGPALDDGKTVVSDRWAYSSMAYQGARHGLSVEELRLISDWSMRGVWPDVVVLIDVPAEVGAARAGATDHYEASGDSLQAQVREVYQSLAAADPERWRVVDGTQSIEEVAAAVSAAVTPFL